MDVDNSKESTKILFKGHASWFKSVIPDTYVAKVGEYRSEAALDQM
jgi:hypothetical protein